MQAQSASQNGAFLPLTSGVPILTLWLVCCQAVAIRLNQTAIEAVTPITSFEKRPEGSPNPDRYPHYRFLHSYGAAWYHSYYLHGGRSVVLSHLSQC